jgi:hypothetical protein
MARKAPTAETSRALFAKSGNRCAFPGCTHELLNEKNEFIAQICHIEAALPGGERFNPLQTDEERRGLSNLILLCYGHHIETNDVNEYPRERLWRMKADHEEKAGKKEFKINESALYKLTHEMERYWDEVELLHAHKHIIKELAVEIDSKASGLSIFRSLNEHLTEIGEIAEFLQESDESLLADTINFLQNLSYNTERLEDVPYSNNPLVNRNWETLNLSLTNTIQKMSVELLQLEIKYLEEYLKTNANDTEAKFRFNVLKDEFKTTAQTAGLVD